ncbi:MAG: hypothetical protein ABL884_08355 [Methyloglobulus sp.]
MRHIDLALTIGQTDTNTSDFINHSDQAEQLNFGAGRDWREAANDCRWRKAT